MADNIQLECPEDECSRKSQSLPANYASAQTAALNRHIQSAHRVTIAPQTPAVVHLTSGPCSPVNGPCIQQAWPFPSLCVPQAYTIAVMKN